MTNLNYQEKIPNNVDLSTDLSLQRALEHWQPKFKNWWTEMGPEGFQASDVYLRTATSVDADGWATYGKVKMPEYRWGIFLNDKVQDRKIHFGDNILPVVAESNIECLKKLFIYASYSENQWRKNCLTIKNY